jgi:hypothetical protein
MGGGFGRPVRAVGGQGFLREIPVLPLVITGDGNADDTDFLESVFVELVLSLSSRSLDYGGKPWICIIGRWWRSCIFLLLGALGAWTWSRLWPGTSEKEGLLRRHLSGGIPSS